MTDNRKAWTPEEDHAINSLVKKYGTHRWSQISKRMGDHFGTAPRTGKQCRQRWHNHLNPKINKSAWTDEEERILFECHQQYGNKWKSITAHLKGRTDNDIKNKFYSSMRKKLRKINKLLGVKNSTSQVREIKPKVLSNIINASASSDENIQQAWRQLSKLIFCKDDRKLQKMIKGEDRDKVLDLIDKISSINETYVENKQGDKAPTKNQSSIKTQQREIKKQEPQDPRPRRLSLRRNPSNKSVSKIQKKPSVSENVMDTEANFNFYLNFGDLYSHGYVSSFTPVLTRNASNNNGGHEKDMDELRDMFLNSPRFTRSFLRTPALTPGSGMGSSGLLPSDIRQAGNFSKPETYDQIQKTIQSDISRNTIPFRQ